MDILVEINASFGLDAEKIVATVTDNGANFVKAFREFGVNAENFLVGMYYVLNPRSKLVCTRRRISNIQKNFRHKSVRGR